MGNIYILIFLTPVMTFCDRLGGISVTPRIRALQRVYYFRLFMPTTYLRCAIHRSLVLTNELLQCKLIILMHHTDCGGQAAAKYHDFAVKKVRSGNHLLRFLLFMLYSKEGVAW